MLKEKIYLQKKELRIADANFEAQYLVFQVGLDILIQKQTLFVAPSFDVQVTKADNRRLDV